MAKSKFTINRVARGEIANDGVSGKGEIDSRDLNITERPDVVDDEDRQYSVETFDVLEKEKLDMIAFFEEPVKIILHPASDEHAATTFPVWVNGKGAEIFQRNRWDEIAYLPVNKPIIIKRKVLSVIVSAKITQIKTDHKGADSEEDYIENKVKPFTKPLNAFSVLEDKNPKGAEWLTEYMNRNM